MPNGSSMQDHNDRARPVSRRSKQIAKNFNRIWGSPADALRIWHAHFGRLVFTEGSHRTIAAVLDDPDFRRPSKPLSDKCAITGFLEARDLGVRRACAEILTDPLFDKGLYFCVVQRCYRLEASVASQQQLLLRAPFSVGNINAVSVNTL